MALLCHQSFSHQPSHLRQSTNLSSQPSQSQSQTLHSTPPLPSTPPRQRHGSPPEPDSLDRQRAAETEELERIERTYCSDSDSDSFVTADVGSFTGSIYEEDEGEAPPGLCMHYGDNMETENSIKYLRLALESTDARDNKNLVRQLVQAHRRKRALQEEGWGTDTDEEEEEEEEEEDGEEEVTERLREMNDEVPQSPPLGDVRRGVTWGTEYEERQRHGREKSPDFFEAIKEKRGKRFALNQWTHWPLPAEVVPRWQQHDEEEWETCKMSRIVMPKMSDNVSVSEVMHDGYETEEGEDDVPMVEPWKVPSHPLRTMLAVEFLKQTKHRLREAGDTKHMPAIDAEDVRTILDPAIDSIMADIDSLFLEAARDNEARDENLTATETQESAKSRWQQYRRSTSDPDADESPPRDAGGTVDYVSLVASRRVPHRRLNQLGWQAVQGWASLTGSWRLPVLSEANARLAKIFAEKTGPHPGVLALQEEISWASKNARTDRGRRKRWLNRIRRKPPFVRLPYHRRRSSAANSTNNTNSTNNELFAKEEEETTSEDEADENATHYDGDEDQYLDFIDEVHLDPREELDDPGSPVWDEEEWQPIDAFAGPSSNLRPSSDDDEYDEEEEEVLTASPQHARFTPAVFFEEEFPATHDSSERSPTWMGFGLSKVHPAVDESDPEPDTDASNTDTEVEIEPQHLPIEQQTQESSGSEREIEPQQLPIEHQAPEYFTSSNNDSMDSTGQPKPKRGRPRKNPITEPAQDPVSPIEDDPTNTTNEPPKPKPGRQPKKQPQVPATTEHVQQAPEQPSSAEGEVVNSTSQPKRKRGRPSKNTPKTQLEVPASAEPVRRSPRNLITAATRVDDASGATTGPLAAESTPQPQKSNAKDSNNTRMNDGDLQAMDNDDERESEMPPATQRSQDFHPPAITQVPSSQHRVPRTRPGAPLTESQEAVEREFGSRAPFGEDDVVLDTQSQDYIPPSGAPINTRKPEPPRVPRQKFSADPPSPDEERRRAASRRAERAKATQDRLSAAASRPHPGQRRQLRDSDFTKHDAWAENLHPSQDLPPSSQAKAAAWLSRRSPADDSRRAPEFDSEGEPMLPPLIPPRQPREVSPSPSPTKQRLAVRPPHKEPKLATLQSLIIDPRTEPKSFSEIMSEDPGVPGTPIEDPTRGLFGDTQSTQEVLDIVGMPDFVIPNEPAPYQFGATEPLQVRAATLQAADDPDAKTPRRSVIWKAGEEPVWEDLGNVMSSPQHRTSRSPTKSNLKTSKFVAVEIPMPRVPSSDEVMEDAPAPVSHDGYSSQARERVRRKIAEKGEISDSADDGGELSDDNDLPRNIARDEHDGWETTEGYPCPDEIPEQIPSSSCPPMLQTQGAPLSTNPCLQNRPLPNEFFPLPAGIGSNAKPSQLALEKREKEARRAARIARRKARGPVGPGRLLEQKSDGGWTEADSEIADDESAVSLPSWDTDDEREPTTTFVDPNARYPEGADPADADPDRLSSPIQPTLSKGDLDPDHYEADAEGQSRPDTRKSRRETFSVPLTLSSPRKPDPPVNDHAPIELSSGDEWTGDYLDEEMAQHVAEIRADRKRAKKQEAAAKEEERRNKEAAALEAHRLKDAVAEEERQKQVVEGEEVKAEEPEWPPQRAHMTAEEWKAKKAADRAAVIRKAEELKQARKGKRAAKRARQEAEREALQHEENVRQVQEVNPTRYQTETANEEDASIPGAPLADRVRACDPEFSESTEAEFLQAKSQSPRPRKQSTRPESSQQPQSSQASQRVKRRKDRAPGAAADAAMPQIVVQPATQEEVQEMPPPPSPKSMSPEATEADIMEIDVPATQELVIREAAPHTDAPSEAPASVIPPAAPQPPMATPSKGTLSTALSKSPDASTPNTVKKLRRKLILRGDNDEPDVVEEEVFVPVERAERFTPTRLTFEDAPAKKKKKKSLAATQPSPVAEAAMGTPDPYSALARSQSPSEIADRELMPPPATKPKRKSVTIQAAPVLEESIVTEHEPLTATVDTPVIEEIPSIDVSDSHLMPPPSSKPKKRESISSTLPVPETTPLEQKSQTISASRPEATDAITSSRPKKKIKKSKHTAKEPVTAEPPSDHSEVVQALPLAPQVGPPPEEPLQKNISSREMETPQEPIVEPAPVETPKKKKKKKAKKVEVPTEAMEGPAPTVEAVAVEVAETAVVEESTPPVPVSKKRKRVKKAPEEVAVEVAQAALVETVAVPEAAVFEPTTLAKSPTVASPATIDTAVEGPKKKRRKPNRHERRAAAAAALAAGHSETAPVPTPTTTTTPATAPTAPSTGTPAKKKSKKKKKRKSLATAAASTTEAAPAATTETPVAPATTPAAPGVGVDRSEGHSSKVTELLRSGPKGSVKIAEPASGNATGDGKSAQARRRDRRKSRQSITPADALGQPAASTASAATSVPVAVTVITKAAETVPPMAPPPIPASTPKKRKHAETQEPITPAVATPATVTTEATPAKPQKLTRKERRALAFKEGKKKARQSLGTAPGTPTAAASPAPSSSLAPAKPPVEAPPSAKRQKTGQAPETDAAKELREAEVAANKLRRAAKRKELREKRRSLATATETSTSNASPIEVIAGEVIAAPEPVTVQTELAEITVNAVAIPAPRVNAFRPAKPVDMSFLTKTRSIEIPSSSPAQSTLAPKAPTYISSDSSEAEESAEEMMSDAEEKAAYISSQAEESEGEESEAEEMPRPRMGVAAASYFLDEAEESENESSGCERVGRGEGSESEEEEGDDDEEEEDLSFVCDDAEVEMEVGVEKFFDESASETEEEAEE